MKKNSITLIAGILFIASSFIFFYNHKKLAAVLFFLAGIINILSSKRKRY